MSRGTAHHHVALDVAPLPHVRAQLDSQLVVPSYKIVGLHAVDSKPCKVSMTTSNDRDASVSAAD